MATSEPRVGRFGTPFTKPRVEDILRSRKLLKDRLRRASLGLRLQWAVIQRLKGLLPEDAFVERVQRDLASLQAELALAHTRCEELSWNLSNTQERLIYAINAARNAGVDLPRTRTLERIVVAAS